MKTRPENLQPVCNRTQVWNRIHIQTRTSRRNTRPTTGVTATGTKPEISEIGLAATGASEDVRAAAEQHTVFPTSFGLEPSDSTKTKRNTAQQTCEPNKPPNFFFFFFWKTLPAPRRRARAGSRTQKAKSTRKHRQKHPSGKKRGKAPPHASPPQKGHKKENHPQGTRALTGTSQPKPVSQEATKPHARGEE